MDQAADNGYRQTRKYHMRWWTLLVLSLSLVIIGLDNTILNVAIPTIQRDLNATASQLQWMVDAYILIFASMLLTMGSLGDRFGRKLTLQLGIIIFCGFSVMAAYSDSSGQLIASRALMGLGGALIMPSTLSIITDVFPREERGKAIGLWAGVAALGIGLGPAIGGWLLEQYWWGSVFLINVPITILALMLGFFLVPKSRAPHPPRIDIIGAGLSMSMLLSLVYAIIEAPSRGWTDTLVLACFGSALVLGLLFVFQELRTDNPMLNLSFFRNPRFSAGAGAITMAFFTLFGVMFLFTQYMQFVLGYTALQAGVRLTPFAFGMLIGAANSHRMVRIFGTNKVVAGGLAVVAVMLFSVYFWGIEIAYWIIGVTIVIQSFGMANTMAPSTDAVMGAVPLAKAGVGSATNDTTRMVGGALGVAIFGSVLNTLYSSNMEAATAQLQPQAAAAARDSVGAAVQIAGMAGGPQGEALAVLARQTFVDAMGVAFVIAAVVAMLTAVAVFFIMPAGHLGKQE